MRNFVTLHATSRFMTFASRPIAAIARTWRSRRLDDALARLDGRTLRDVGINRCGTRCNMPLHSRYESEDEPSEEAS